MRPSTKSNKPREVSTVNNLKEILNVVIAFINDNVITPLKQLISKI